VKRVADPDEGTIVLGWLTKLVVTLLVLGFLAYDGISIVSANFSASDRANSLASEAADDVKSMGLQQAYNTIEAEAEQKGDTIAPADFRVASDGHVTLVLQHEARSLWMDRISSLKKYLRVRATGEGAPAS